MNEQSVSIKEGIRLHYISCNKFTSNTFTVHFLSPLTQKGAPLANLLAKVLKKGCLAYPTQEDIAKRAEELYGTSIVAGVSKIGETQSFFISFCALDNPFAFDGTDIAEGAFSLLTSLLLEPCLENGVFLPHVVKREKTALLDRIAAKINNKGSYAMQRCREIMCETEAYRFSLEGKREDVENVESAELYEAYLKTLGSAPIEVYYIGKESLDDVFLRTSRLFANFSPRTATEFNTEVLYSSLSVKRVRETADAVQGKLVMGFRTNCTAKEPDFLALMLFDAVYGSSPISKLFMNVREKLSLCYYCASATDLDKGVMFVYSGVENENAEAAENEILKQLDELKMGVVTENELLCAKATLVDNLKSIEDNAYSIERFLLTQHLRENNLTPDHYIKRIEALTVQDVVRVAKRISLDTVYFLAGNKKGGEEDV